MSDLQVSPWKRWGHDRLYVSRPDGENVAWFDRTTGQLTVQIDGYREAALAALAPYLGAATSRASARQPAIEADGPGSQVHGVDLAANRPGEALRAKLAELEPSVWRSLLNRILGRRTEADSWRTGLRGEQRVGAELQRLTRNGWHVLHSIPLPRDVDIDHLLIGPGGVFCVNTKHHPNATIWVGDQAVKIGGQSYPYVRKSRSEAKGASAALTQACGFPVQVNPALVFAGAGKVTAVPTLHDVRVLTERQISMLGGVPAVMGKSETDSIYAAGRQLRTWERA